MRTIQFRGKRLDNGEWIFGSLLQEILNGALTESIIIDRGFARDCKQIQVNTAGQSTNKKDKSGQTIFEDDLIEYCDEIYLVIFKDGCLGYKGEYEFIPLCHIDTKKDLIVGNIHDNPNLLPLIADHND